MLKYYTSGVVYEVRTSINYKDISYVCNIRYIYIYIYIYICLCLHDLKKYEWQKSHQENLTGTESAYYPNKNKDDTKKKYKSWKN